MAVALGGVALWLTLSTRPAPHDAESPEETVEILVAAKDLPRRTIFTEELISTSVVAKRFPRDQAPKGYIADVSPLRGRGLRFAVPRGEPIPAEGICGKPTVLLNPGEDFVSLPLLPNRWPQTAVGSRVDIIVSRMDGLRREV